MHPPSKRLTSRHYWFFLILILAKWYTNLSIPSLMTSPPPARRVFSRGCYLLLLSVCLSLWSLRYPHCPGVLPQGSSQIAAQRGGYTSLHNWWIIIKTLGLFLNLLELCEEGRKDKKESMEWQCCCWFPNLKKILYICSRLNKADT